MDRTRISKRTQQEIKILPLIIFLPYLNEQGRLSNKGYLVAQPKRSLYLQDNLDTTTNATKDVANINKVPMR